MRESIRKLLDTDVTAAEIARHTDINASTIQKLRLGSRSIGKLSLENAENLTNYYENINKVLGSRYMVRNMYKQNIYAEYFAFKNGNFEEIN